MPQKVTACETLGARAVAGDRSRSSPAAGGIRCRGAAAIRQSRLIGSGPRVCKVAMAANGVSMGPLSGRDRVPKPMEVPFFPGSGASITVERAGELKGDLIAVGLYEEDVSVTDDQCTFKGTPPSGNAVLAEMLPEFVAAAEFAGKKGQSHTGRIGKGSYLTIFGLGPKQEAAVNPKWGPSPFQAMGEAIAKAAKANKLKSACAHVLATMPEGAAGKIAAGSLLGAYESTRFKSKVKPLTTLSSVAIVLPENSNIDAEQQAIDRAVALAQGTTLARYLVEAPANVCTPTTLASVARKMAADAPDTLSCEILEREDCHKLGMGCYLAVAECSEEPPRFIHMTYKPQGEVKRRVALVGKGLTHDTGGYNLKVGGMIEMMKFDMGGSAAVLGATYALSMLRPAGVEVHCVVAACENMIDGKGLLPGDVLRAANGKTIEILNTDAEGRLTLADALWYAETQCGAKAIVDAATLTGACMIALGKKVAGLFTPHDDMAASLTAAATKSGESLWRMPMEERYWEKCKSKIADMTNTGDRMGGAIAAALIMQQFIDTSKTQWAHLDIAGTAWNDEEGGSTGFGAATLALWAEAQGARQAANGSS